MCTVPTFISADAISRPDRASLQHHTGFGEQQTKEGRTWKTSPFFLRGLPGWLPVCDPQQRIGGGPEPSAGDRNLRAWHNERSILLNN
jgi:hypothetical protein